MENIIVSIVEWTANPVHVASLIPALLLLLALHLCVQARRS